MQKWSQSGRHKDALSQWEKGQISKADHDFMRDNFRMNQKDNEHHFWSHSNLITYIYSSVKIV